MAKKTADPKVTALTLVERATSLQVTTQADAEEVGAVLKLIKEAKTKIEEMFGPQVKAAYAAWQTSLEQKNNFTKPLDNAEKQLKSKLSDYQLRVEEETAAAKLAMESCTEEGSFCPAPYIENEKGSVAGIAATADIEVTVTDTKKFLAAVVKGAIKIDLDRLIEVKVGVIKQFVKATGIRNIPGVTIKDKKTFAVKG